jgi:hypothetical protein
LRAVLTDGERAAALVASGRERAEQFSMARLADLYLARFRAIVDRAERKRRRGGRVRRRRADTLGER